MTKPFFRLTARLVLSAALATVALASPASAGGGVAWTGVWKNTNNTVHIKAAPCGNNMCATVVWANADTKAAVAAKGRNIIGMQLLRDFRQTTPSEWKGSVYIPDQDLTVSGTITVLDPKTMRATGCGFLGLICQTRHWQRIS